MKLPLMGECALSHEFSMSNVRVQILSDLHVDVNFDWDEHASREFLESLSPSESVDAVVVAGDIADGADVVKAIDVLAYHRASRGEHVIYVPGNHDFYYRNPADVVADFHRLEKTHGNLHVLQNKCWDHRGVRFVGTTLWFGYDPDNLRYFNRFTDLVCIRPKSYTPLEWIERENDIAQEFLRQNHSSSDVVVTHHIPTKHCIHPKWRSSDLNRFFVCDLPDLIDDTTRDRTWIFGHTHDTWDVTCGRTRLIANPLGRRHENNRQGNFASHLLIDIPIPAVEDQKCS